MKFKVNERCIGCGLCTNTCPEVFNMTDEGVAEAVSEAVSGDVKEQAMEALEACPVEAIEKD